MERNVMETTDPTHIITQLTDSLEFLLDVKENTAEDDEEAQKQIDGEISAVRRQRQQLKLLNES